jgi:hypothetical protein
LACNSLELLHIIILHLNQAPTITDRIEARHGNRIEAGVAIVDGGSLRIAIHPVGRSWPWSQDIFRDSVVDVTSAVNSDSPQDISKKDHRRAPKYIIIFTMAVTFDSIKQAVGGLKALLPEGFVPQFGIIGGSGLSALETAIEGPRTEVPYEQIQGFPISTGQSVVQQVTSSLGPSSI